MDERVSITVRIPTVDKRRLEALADSTGHTKDSLVAKAIQEYLDNQSWQIEETKRALAEAESGDFVTDREVEAFFAEWKV